MFLGSKGYTKDLDLVVSTEDEYLSVLKALSGLGFIGVRPTTGMDKVDVSDTQTRGEYRIDLFKGKVCGELQLSESMKSRSFKRFESDTVSLHSCSAEDLFLLKSVTEREGDLNDGNSLIINSPGFDWDVFLEEVEVQMGFGEPVWITYTMERLSRMHIDDRRPDVFSRVSVLEKKYLEDWADRFERDSGAE